jgi:methylmalonyl-CoA mutase
MGETNTPQQKIRFVTAASLFDGHDAAINIIRRLLQAHGAEVIHLGHNRSVAEIVDAAIQEDADGIAVSSYQGGHMESVADFLIKLAESMENTGGLPVRILSSSSDRMWTILLLTAERVRGHLKNI